MSDVAHSIDLNLAEKLRDRAYRQHFFSAECSAEIAAQLIALRKRRHLDQGDVADLIGTQQPAISRYEKADYLSRSFSILQKIANALDARIRVLIEPSEDILREYADDQAVSTADDDVLRNILRPLSNAMSSETKQSNRLGILTSENDLSAALYQPETPMFSKIARVFGEENSAASFQRPLPGLSIAIHN